MWDQFYKLDWKNLQFALEFKLTQMTQTFAQSPDKSKIFKIIKIKNIVLGKV